MEHPANPFSCPFCGIVDIVAFKTYPAGEFYHLLCHLGTLSFLFYPSPFSYMGSPVPNYTGGVSCQGVLLNLITSLIFPHPGAGSNEGQVIPVRCRYFSNTSPISITTRLFSLSFVNAPEPVNDITATYRPINAPGALAAIGWLRTNVMT